MSFHHTAETSPSPFVAARRIRIMLVDDHPAITAGLRRLIGDQPDLAVVCAADGAREAFSDATRARPDVAVVDYQLRGESGLILARRLKRLPHPPRVLMYTAFADGAFTAAAIVAGADGITGKGALADELCNSIRAVARGRRVFPQVPPPLFEAMSSGLSRLDEAIFRMLLHGVSPVTVADAIQMDPVELDRRRDTILRAITREPGPAPASTERSMSR